MATNGKCASRLHAIIDITQYTLYTCVSIGLKVVFLSLVSQTPNSHHIHTLTPAIECKLNNGITYIAFIYRDEQQNASIKLFEYRQIFRLLICLPRCQLMFDINAIIKWYRCVVIACFVSLSLSVTLAMAMTWRYFKVLRSSHIIIHFLN